MYTLLLCFRFPFSTSLFFLFTFLPSLRLQFPFINPLFSILVYIPLFYYSLGAVDVMVCSVLNPGLRCAQLLTCHPSWHVMGAGLDLGASASCSPRPACGAVCRRFAGFCGIPLLGFCAAGMGGGLSVRAVCPSPSRNYARTWRWRVHAPGPRHIMAIPDQVHVGSAMHLWQLAGPITLTTQVTLLHISILVYWPLSCTHSLYHSPTNFFISLCLLLALVYIPYLLTLGFSPFCHPI